MATRRGDGGVVETYGSRPHDLRLNLVRRPLTLYLRNSRFGGLT